MDNTPSTPQGLRPGVLKLSTAQVEGTREINTTIMFYDFDVLKFSSQETLAKHNELVNEMIDEALFEKKGNEAQSMIDEYYRQTVPDETGKRD